MRDHFSSGSLAKIKQFDNTLVSDWKKKIIRIYISMQSVTVSQERNLAISMKKKTTHAP